MVQGLSDIAFNINYELNYLITEFFGKSFPSRYLHTSDDLAKEVVAAFEAGGEKLWRLPMEDSYWESMKSGIADMVNTGGRAGGSITAALFLKHVIWNELANNT